MTRAELVAELKVCEKRIAQLNDTYQQQLAAAIFGRTSVTPERPSVADPVTCERRKELRQMLIKREYTS